MSRRIFPTWTTISMAVIAATAALAPLAREAEAQEPASCLLDDPNAWPKPSKPYFMLAIDTSGSMGTAVATANSCSYAPNDRNAHSRCAIKNSVQAFGGQVNFGLANFAVVQENCDAGCYANCDYLCTAAEQNTRGFCAGCGPLLGAGAATASGAIIQVPMQQDDFWNTPSSTTNVDTLLQYVDNDCTGSTELFAAGNTPLNGILRDMQRYFGGTYVNPDTGVALASPLATQDRTGSGVNGSTGCRSVNVILQTDGDETCDSQADAVAAANALYNTGVTVGGKTYRIRTYVINFQGGNQANTDAFAAAGGTTASYFATNEDDLAAALASIVSGSVSPETCDNVDNNCNGCTDEGYKHYCDRNQTCCSAARATCLQNYKNSITAADPDGDLTLLPCTNATQQGQPANWLCFNPGEACDNIDNNCQDGTDEGVNRCGNPPHCPGPESCNGIDDDCDGVTDNGVCNGCVPQPEVCDGCDNDCNGIVDDGIGSIQCGVANPPSCLGTRTCTTPQIAVAPGQCSGGATFSACSTTGNAETCNGIDDDCDGVIDDGVLPQACVPPGTPGGLIYTAPSQCRQGQQACAGNGAFGPCVGFVGPSTEICDGVDNDCDGLVDAADPDMVGGGEECGLNGGACTPGLTQCVGGALSCVGATGGGPEICNGVDDDCDGFTDEAPLADAPPTAGCWTIPGNTCVYLNETWDPPPGADCTSVGTLDPPCAAGTLVCAGAQLWQCQNDVLPQGEACDGVDNDCDGTVDDGDFPEEGQACGDADPPCVQGLTVCQNGFLDCVGGVGPQEEVCDGIDNDCDLEIDEGIVVGTPCTPEYDTEAFPGDRSGSPCQPGVLQCDARGGQVCVGGVGPSAEVCDGIDNDCDGDVDETGDAPDGIDGTDNPLPPPDAAIGDACGNTEGICTEGAWGCLNGRFECLGGQGPQVEACDCSDNDCDGITDNENENNTPPLCGSGKDCVKAGESCQCAAPCGSGEFECPAGQECVTVTSSESGEPLEGRYCVTNACAGGCADKTVKDANDVVLCAPEGTLLDDCRKVPECVCKGQSGCQPPCFGVTCEGALSCASFGEAAGTCAPNNCFNVGCQGCETYCSGTGDCIANPCLDPEVNDCTASQVCSPDGEGGVDCKASCADVSCGSGTICKGGECVPDCPTCGDTQVCDYGQDPPACVDSQCNEDSCPNGGCCDPLTGACGACPCEGVVCPASQVCVDDECLEPGTSATGAGGGASTSAGAGGEGAGSAVATGSTTGSGNGSGSGKNGVFGLATGGGGCACDVGAGADGSDLGKLALLAGLGLVVGARRRRRAEGRATEAPASSEEVSR